MKSQLLIYTLLFCFALSKAQNTVIPDPNFEQALIDLGYDVAPINGFVPTANINTVTLLNVSSKNITDLTGIEGFVALESLYCINNQLTSLDISNNTALMDLRCYSNNLTNLDVTNNTALTLLHCYYNDLTTLDISNNVLLEDLRCGYTLITSLDLTNNPQLKTLIIGNGLFTSLDVSNNPLLELLRCENNQLTNLNIDNNSALTNLYIDGNNISSLNLNNNINLTLLSCIVNDIEELDLSNNIGFTTLYCQSNQLTSLNLKNGNNVNFTQFFALNNPNLFCIEVDNATYSTTNWTNIDPQTIFSEDCSLSVEDMEAMDIKVYPNPVSDILTISSVTPINSIDIYDMLGKKVMSISNANHINVSQLISGVYFVKIKSNTGEVTKKIIKN